MVRYGSIRRWIAASLTLLAMMGWFPSYAAEEAKKDEKPAAEEKADAVTAADPADEGIEDKSYRFAPDFCDFEITLPEEPAVMQKCLGDSGCFDVHSYTMVYDLQTTVDVSVTCNPSTPASFDKYNEAVMRAALAGMVENRNLETHEVRFMEDHKTKTKSAALSGTGTTGRQEKIYTAQLWIGQNSVFTIQAELVGGAHEVADKSFSEILSSIKTKKGKQISRPKKAVIPKQNNQ
ncbi:MAG TPA: hypothetical protein VFS88_00345 [Micavibrio sp.]|nr:hypothetical protein [Micavibrio sp.]